MKRMMAKAWQENQDKKNKKENLPK